MVTPLGALPEAVRNYMRPSTESLLPRSFQPVEHDLEVLGGQMPIDWSPSRSFICWSEKIQSRARLIRCGDSYIWEKAPTQIFHSILLTLSPNPEPITIWDVLHTRGPLFIMSSGPEQSWASDLVTHFSITPAADAKDQDPSLTAPYSCVNCLATGSNRLSHYDPSQSCNYCNGCNETYCNKCWDDQRSHIRGTLTITGIPHEKTDPNVAELVRATLQSNLSKDEQQLLYQGDETATWFGLIGVDGEPTLRDYGRYADLASRISLQSSERQYPSLISFVGPTGQYLFLHSSQNIMPAQWIMMAWKKFIQ